MPQIISTAIGAIAAEEEAVNSCNALTGHKLAGGNPTQGAQYCIGRLWPDFDQLQCIVGEVCVLMSTCYGNISELP